MKLSIPKPTREMLAATTPAATAIKPSRLFHAIVKYSSRLPRWAIRLARNGQLTHTGSIPIFLIVTEVAITRHLVTTRRHAAAAVIAKNAATAGTVHNTFCPIHMSQLWCNFVPFDSPLSHDVPHEPPASECLRLVVAGLRSQRATPESSFFHQHEENRHQN